MERRNTLVERDNGQAMATFSLIAVIVVVALIGLFVWQPWNMSTRTSSTTTVTAPAPAAGGAANSGSASTSNGGAK
ncbi:MAG: hypothetical protein ABR975_05950 [Vulcanimicrobiaceae bacterium]|jgi:ABC-type transporter Mla subunit MlaD